MIRRNFRFSLVCCLLGFLLITPTRPALAAAPKVVIIDIHGSIWPSMAVFVKGQIDDAWKAGAAGVILDIDSAGGSVQAAEDIKTAVIGRARDFPSGIAAFVHDRARGPGFIIPLVCKPLALSKSASFGAAA